LDVHYTENLAVTACVEFGSWIDRDPTAIYVSAIDCFGDYVPGRFFEREMPCLLDALNRIRKTFDILVIDGFVHLKPPVIKGLGYHLAEAMPYPVAVIGVAKNPLKLADQYVEVLRGRSRKPLFLSSIHIPVHRAADLLKGMFGAYRIPRLIKIADQVARAGVNRGTQRGITG